VASSDPSCVIATSVKFVERGVRMAVADAIAGPWQGGVQTLDIGQGAVGLSLRNDPALTSDVAERVLTIADRLAAGSISMSP